MTDYTPAIAITTTVLGWCVVHWLSSQRDRKKEWRDFARSTSKLVDTIEKMAIRYHTNPSRDIDLESTLIALISKLDVYVQTIGKNIKIENRVSFFRAAITLDNFQAANFLCQQRSSDIIQDISYQATRLREKLLMAE